MTDSAPAATPEAGKPGGRYLVLILGVLTALGPLSIDMYLPSFPSVAADLRVAVADVQLTLAAYLAGLAVGQLLYGVLSDRLGRRRPLLTGLALYVFGSLVCALAPTLPLLVAARFLQALGGCAGLVVSRAVVRDHFDVEDSARLYSTLMLIMGVAPILAPLLGGQLVLLGWRAIFWALLVASLALVAVVGLWLAESLPRERRDPRPVRTQLRAMLTLFGHLRFVRLSVASGAMLGAMFAYISGAPAVFMEIHGLSPTGFAAVFGCTAASLIAASQVNRWLAPRFGVERVLRAAIRVAVVALGAFAAGAWAGAGLALIIPCLVVTAACFGLVMPNATAAAMAPYGREAGRASAVMGTLQSLLGAVTATAVSALADATARPMASVMCACALLALAALPPATAPSRGASGSVAPSAS
ncbi:MAG: multidrug effflux MFS transporter [Myxococcales bacterium]|nr:multidrug effflux MFS transporter [Myxococcales bacterium]MCB9732357.1 multidrug effflux MFS transporter [Deltaproteobacteria bacterium]